MTGSSNSWKASIRVNAIVNFNLWKIYRIVFFLSSVLFLFTSKPTFVNVDPVSKVLIVPNILEMLRAEWNSYSINYLFIKSARMITRTISKCTALRWSITMRSSTSSAMESWWRLKVTSRCLIWRPTCGQRPPPHRLMMCFPTIVSSIAPFCTRFVYFLYYVYISQTTRGPSLVRWPKNGPLAVVSLWHLQCWLINFWYVWLWEL